MESFINHNYKLNYSLKDKIIHKSKKNIIESEKGYFYKINKDGSKKRISKNEFEKNVNKDKMKTKKNWW
jgi:hypothetical protein